MILASFWALLWQNRKNMKSIFAAILLSLGLFIQPGEVTKAHLQVFEGEWTGSLTYLNYGDDATLVTLPLKSEASLDAKGVRFVYYFTEPGGRIEERKDRLYFKENQLMFSGKWDIVASKAQDLQNWSMELKKTGMDNNKKSDFKETITVTPDKITVTKMVKYHDGEEYFMRNQYVFER